MTAQPTLGEVLNGESVRLLLPGDRLRRNIDGLICVFDNPMAELTIATHDEATGRFWGGHYTAWSFVSRPQPSGGQDGGGEIGLTSANAGTLWALFEAFRNRVEKALDVAHRAEAVRAPFGSSPDEAATYHGVRRNLLQWVLEQMPSRADTASAALASPAKATGWPSREVLHDLLGDDQNGGFIRDLCYTVWQKARYGYDGGPGDWGTDTLPTVQAGVNRVRSLLLPPRPEDEGAAT